MQRTSTYNKIREIIDAAANYGGGISELARAIKGKSRSFVYFKRGDDGVVRQYACDEPTIRRKIRFCIRLGLLEDEKNCTLTSAGRNARLKGRFDLQLQTAINAYLEKRGTPMSEIESAINNLVLPHTAALYQYLTPDISEDVFRTCMFLLSECGKEKGQNVFQSFDRKLYLTEKKIKHAQKAMEKKR